MYLKKDALSTLNCATISNLAKMQNINRSTEKVFFVKYHADSVGLGSLRQDFSFKLLQKEVSMIIFFLNLLQKH